MNKLKVFYYSLSPYIRNKYVLAFLFFILWMFVFDTNNIFNQYQLYKSKQDYLKQKKYYYKEIEKIKEENEALFGNDEKLEKFAREKYLMKKDSETIFVFEYDTIQKK